MQLIIKEFVDRGRGGKIIDKILKSILPKQVLSKVKHNKVVMIDAEEAYLYLKEEKPKPKSSFKVKGKIRFINGNYLLSLNWAFYSNMIKRAGHGNLIKKYKIEDRLHDYDLTKELSTFALKEGPKIRGFFLLVGIDHLYGYNYKVDEKSIYEKVTNWVSDVFTPNYGGDEEHFNRMFADEVAKILNYKDGVVDCPYSLEEFASQLGLTGTTGSAYDYEHEKLDVEYHGIRVKNTNNKYAKSAVLSTENKVNRLKNERAGKAKVSIKVEVFPKIRLIVSQDYNMTLKMRYVDTWLGTWMAGNSNSTLWQSDAQRLVMWTDFCKQGDWNVPIDQSAFDHHVSKKMVKIMLDGIKNSLLLHGSGPNKGSMVNVMDTIIRGIESQTVQIDNKYVPGKDKGTTSIEYKNGVLSGWQWTAFLDTLANIAEKNMAIRLLRDRGLEIKMLQFNAQGDDQLTKFKYLYEGILYWAALSEMGFEIHLTKNFFSNIHNEYLRKYSTEEGMNGYPARMINAIMWFYPGQAFERDELARLAGMKDKWLKLSERLRIKFHQIKDLFVKDVKATKVKNEIIDIYLSMKKVNGGAELVEPFNNKIIKREGGEYVGGIDIKGSGYRDFQLLYGPGQERELKNWTLQSVHIDETDVDGDEMRKGKKYEIIEAEMIKDIDLNLIQNDVLSRPKILRGVAPVTIVGQSDEIISRYYPTFDLLAKNTRAPRSWVKEWITGKTKIIAPILPRCSDETSSMLIAPYKNSIYKAMMCKQMKGVNNKWQTILAKADVKFKQMDLIVPDMFY